MVCVQYALGDRVFDVCVLCIRLLCVYICVQYLVQYAYSYSFCPGCFECVYFSPSRVAAPLC